ncbi:MAG: bifunctional folylpolyglutamate synthase/dihydrofolate synthase [Acutalibacteraceae bacterium]
MTYDQAMQKIHGLLRFGSRPGLDRITKLLTLLGNPEKKLKFIHVAGTNGKGSICAMLSSILKSQGYNTGLYTSPYVIDFRERIQLNGEMIPEQELADLVDEVYPYLEQMEENDEIITEFEFITAIAMKWFLKMGCDVVVLETGLGGRFDATNTIETPLCSIIASISLDHTAILGDTLEKIAFEKCGIIKSNGRTVFLPQESEVNNVIEQTAYVKHNLLYRADTSDMEILEKTIDGMTVKYKDTQIFMRLIGNHQINNASTVLSAVNALRDSGLTISDEAVKSGLADAFMPARTECISKEPCIILDGGHNPGGIRALAEYIKDTCSDKKVTFVMGMLADKDVSASLELLRGIPSRIIATEPDNPRKMSAPQLAQLAENICNDVYAEPEPHKAISLAMNTMPKDGILIVCGSLYLAAQVREFLLNGNF